MTDTVTAISGCDMLRGMKMIEFVGAPGSPQAGKPVFVNPETVGIVLEGAGSKPGSRNNSGSLRWLPRLGSWKP